MKIVELDTHLNCKCYQPNPMQGFSMISILEGEYFTPNSLGTNKIIYLHKGAVRIVSLEKENMNVRKHHFLFMPAQKAFKIRADEEAVVIVLDTVHIDIICPKMTIETLEKEKELGATIGTKQRFYKANSALRSFFNSLANYLSCGFYCEEIHQIKEREFFLVLRATFVGEQLREMFQPVFERRASFKARILNYAQKAQSAKQLAEMMGIDRGHFYKVFKEEFGVPPYEWMLQQKAEKTLKLLGQKNRPLKNIAEELHFTSQSHLNRFCKKYFGKTAKKIQELL